MKEKTLLINLENNFPSKKYIDLISAFYQIGPIETDNMSIRCLNNQFRLNEIALEERDKYTDWIADLNKYFLSKKLTYKNKLSLFYFSDLSNKRNDIFETYDLICNTLLIKEIISKYKFTKIIINGGNRYLYESISSIKDIEISKIQNGSLCRFIYSILDNIKGSLFAGLIKNLRLILKYFIYRICFLKTVQKSTNTKYKSYNIFFTRFPKHFEENIYKESKYGYMVRDNDQFITSLLCDGMYQNLNIFEAIKSRRNLFRSKKHIIIDDYVTFRSLIRSIFDSFLLFNKVRKLTSVKYHYYDIEISHSIYKEINFSYQRVLGTLKLCRGLQKVIVNVDARRFIYHLHEYIYGRMISFVLHNNGIQKTFGFQHGPSSNHFLTYSNSKKELNFSKNNYLNSVPIPNYVFVEDKKSAELYQNSGYNNIIMLKKVPRLTYLYNLNVKNKKDIYLIASGLYDFKLIYQEMLKEINNKPNHKFLFKPHPKSEINLKNYPLPHNAQYTNLNIKYLLSRSKKLYATYSSVLAEAIYLNIKVRIIQFPGKVCMPTYGEEI